MAKLKESKDFIKKLLTTGIRGIDWPNKTYLIAVIKNRRGEIIWKKNYQTLESEQDQCPPNKHHTERQMLDDQTFRECLEKKDAGEIILTSNYSPCKNCAKDLKNFYENSTELKLTIRFSHPYETKKENHLKGFKDLDRPGITLEAMNKKSWLDVLINEEHWFEMVMKFMFDLDPRKVGERDDTTREKLKDEIFVGKMERLNVGSDSV